MDQHCSAGAAAAWLHDVTFSAKELRVTEQSPMAAQVPLLGNTTLRVKVLAPAT
jgi:hypothetical protein